MLGLELIGLCTLILLGICTNSPVMEQPKNAKLVIVQYAIVSKSLGKITIMCNNC